LAKPGKRTKKPVEEKENEDEVEGENFLD